MLKEVNEFCTVETRFVKANRSLSNKETSILRYSFSRFMVKILPKLIAYGEKEKRYWLMERDLEARMQSTSIGAY